MDEETKNLQLDFFNTCNSALTAPIFYVQRFEIRAVWPRITLWANDEKRRQLAAAIHDNLREVVDAAHFYYEAQLSVNIGDDQISIVYQDDIYDFTVHITSDGMEVVKRGVDVDTFSKWAYKIRDSIPSIFSNVLNNVNKLYERKLQFTSVRYEIKFLLFDFLEQKTKVAEHHALIMSRLIKKFPGQEGQLEDQSSVKLNNVPRVDYNVHQWSGDGDKARLTTYQVEAPANRNRSTLWFTFALSGTSYTSPEGDRYRCNPGELISEADKFFDFVKHKAIRSFMGSLLSGYSFTTGTQV